MGANNADFNGGRGPSVSMLGVTGRLDPTKNQAVAQSYAESYWPNIDSSAEKTISERGAKDLIGETLHHPAMDEIPHIDHIRKTFNPEEQVHVVNNLPAGHMGHLETPRWGPGLSRTGRQLIRLNDLPALPLRTATVTHELAHLLSYPTIQGISWAHVGNADRQEGIGHSWPHARAHIYAARIALGNEAADNLRSIYRAHGISFGHRNI